MKILKKYDIDIFMLSNEKHKYEMEVDEEFFELFEDSLIDKGKGTIQVELDKSETMVQAFVKGNGKIELICDRSLEQFEHPFNFAEKIIFKYGDEASEIDDGLYIIPKSTQKINLAKEIYDYISLSVPMKKLHPKFQEDQDDDFGQEAEGKLVYSSTGSDGEEAENTTNKNGNESEEIDPRWSILKKLKDNNNNLN